MANDNASPQVWWNYDAQGGWTLRIGTPASHIAVNPSHATDVMQRLRATLSTYPATCVQCGKRFVADTPSGEHCSVQCLARTKGLSSVVPLADATAHPDDEPRRGPRPVSTPESGR